MVFRTLADEDPITARNFDQRVKPLRPALLKLARRQLLPDDAEDVLQTTLIYAYQARERYDPRTGERGFAHWLRSILRCAVADFFRAHAHRAEETEIPEGFEDTAVSCAAVGGRFTEAASEELRRRMERVVLSEKQRAILTRHLNGESQAAIAESLCCSQQTVWYHLQVAIRRLREPGEIELSAYAELLFAECADASVYFKPCGVWDRKGTAEAVQKRRYRGQRS